MQLIHKEKIFILLTAFIFCFCTSDCRKVTAKHNEYVGEWRTEYYDCQHYVIIENNDKGTYGATGSITGCVTTIKGKARISKNHLYVGYVEFKIINAPEPINDSIKLNPTIEEYTQVSAKMTLKNSVFRNKETFTYYKIK